MADRVLPLVRLFSPCQGAILDLADEQWMLKRPLHGVELPAGTQFPYRERVLWLYAQLIYGVGDFNLSVQFVDQESNTVIGTAKPVRRSFDGGNRGRVTEEVFCLKRLMFPQPGLYEFRLIANHFPLPDGVVLFRVMG